VHAPVSRLLLGEPALARLGGAAPLQWQFRATRADLVPAWVARAAAGITIAVVDTGADATAPDLAAKAPIQRNVVTGANFVSDPRGHGTLVASLAGGSVTNGDGIAGFGGDAGLMIVQANRSGNTFTDVDEAAAIVWAVDNGARIINLSIGGVDTSEAERQAIEYAISRGVLLVAAVGNGGEHGNRISYPAALLGGRGLTVGASTPGGKRAKFSSAASYLSLLAPGVRVLGALSPTASASAFPRARIPGATAAGTYGYGTGTSYATPQVAGAAALVWATDPTRTATEVAQILQRTATGRARWSPQVGYGILDVAAAVASALGVPPPERAATKQR
jgi:subtilisin family serine protease